MESHQYTPLTKKNSAYARKESKVTEILNTLFLSCTKDKLLRTGSACRPAKRTKKGKLWTYIYYISFRSASRHANERNKVDKKFDESSMCNRALQPRSIQQPNIEK